MSQLPSVIRPSDCCATTCDDVVTSNVPGPAGADGAAGAAGTNGTNAFTTTTAAFAMPAVSANAAVTVAVSTWASVGQVIYISNAGYFSVAAVPDGTHITATNLGYTGNVAPATVVGGGQTVSPAGIKGTDGAAGSATLNDISPTTTKGDLIVDNGANSPNASDVRLGVGADGQMIAAVAAQPTGLQWQSILPNAATDNAVPRFNGAAGTPIPLQTSLMEISDTGALQSTPSGGNARGVSAVDLQVVRAAATQVASGLRGFIGAGTSNTASGQDSGVVCGAQNQATATQAFVGGGIGNVASGTSATISAGDGNTASSTNSTVGGGELNVASNTGAVVSGGTTNIASGLYSCIPGGSNGVASGSYSQTVGRSCTAAGENAAASGYYASAPLYGQSAKASGRFSAAGDAQVSNLILRGQTTDATPTEIFLDGAAAQITIASDTTWAFRMLIVARRTDVNDESAAYQLLGCIDRNAAVGTTALVGAVSTTVIAEDTAAWAVAATADAATGALVLTVTGEAAKNISWVAAVEITQVTG